MSSIKSDTSYLEATPKVQPSHYALLLLMGILWGLTLSLAKIGVLAGGHPVGMALWQVSTSSSFLFFLLLLQSKLPVINANVSLFGLICGCCGVVFPAISLFWCARYLSAGVIAIAFASMPLFTYLLTVMLKIETAHPSRLLGVAIGLIAMALLVLPDSALPTPELAPWALLALAASISMSIENTYAGGYRPPNVGSMELSFIRQGTAALILLPLALASETTLPLFETWGAIQYTATGNGLLSAIAFTILLYVIKTAGTIFASQTAYIVTIAGVIWGMILFSETHSIYIWLSLALTLFGIGLVSSQHSSSHKKPA